jgi:putative protease
MNKIEIMAPAGSFEALAAAIKAGADSVYFGVGMLNMRARSVANFSLDDLARIARKCKKSGVKSYLTLNVVVFDSEIEQIKTVCDAAVKAGISAVIASDIAVIKYANSIGLPVHISVQANICNLEAVKFFAQYADVMVLARELSLAQIKYIIDGIERENITGPSGEKVRVEIFVHGALCVSFSEAT